MTTYFRTDNYKCDVCGKGFYLRPSGLLKSKTHCCSHECQNTLRSSRMRGDGNHQYGLLGELNSSFKSDWMITSYGYLAIRNTTHPARMYNDFIFAHRLVVEEYLKTEDPGSDYLVTIDNIVVLSPDVVVHHIDGNRLNNLIHNLEIMDLGDHLSLHNKDLDITRNWDGTFNSVSHKKTGSGRLERKHITDAGQDIYSTEEKIIYPGHPELFSTSLSISVPSEYVGLIWSRSGLSAKFGIEVGAGCIDCGYTGELKVLLYNHSDSPYKVSIGDAIAQLLTVPISLRNYDGVGTLPDTTRGAKGFGSTGV